MPTPASPMKNLLTCWSCWGMGTPNGVSCCRRTTIEWMCSGCSHLGFESDGLLASERSGGAGLVTVKMVLDPDGHHHKQYYAVVADITVRFDTNGFNMDVERSSNQQNSSNVRSYRYRLGFD